MPSSYISTDVLLLYPYPFGTALHGDKLGASRHKSIASSQKPEVRTRNDKKGNGQQS